MKVHGIHHITAIASDPQTNVDFYTDVLGLRLVKRTVNFDDPGAYHFYFGDRIGRPGTIITFFPWPNAQQGQIGAGQVIATSYATPSGSIEFWKERLRKNRVPAEETPSRFGQRALRFADPDGLGLEIIETNESTEAEPWAHSPIPAEFALRGFHTPTLASGKRAATAEVATSLLGFELVGEENGRARYSVSPGNPSAQIDLIDRPEKHGHVAAGTVHHIAFRAADEEEQKVFRERVEEAGLMVTPVIDRQYFHSIYFREPGGILFEIATDKPGFATDESEEHLGEALKLPPQYELHRSSIEAVLPAITLRTHPIVRQSGGPFR